MNKIGFLPSGNLIGLWEQSKHIFRNRFYQQKSTFGDFPNQCVYKNPNLQKGYVPIVYFKDNDELRFLEIYSLYPFFI